MLSDTDYEENLYKYQYMLDMDEFPLLGVINIDEKLWGRLDIVIGKYYGGDMRYLQMLLDFNRISDVTKIEIGQSLKLIDFQNIGLNDIKINDILDSDIIPGICSTTDSGKVNSDTQATINKSSNKTAALPKLNIIQTKVGYNDATGILTF